MAYSRQAFEDALVAACVQAGLVTGDNIFLGVALSDQETKEQSATLSRAGGVASARLRAAPAWSYALEIRGSERDFAMPVLDDLLDGLALIPQTEVEIGAEINDPEGPTTIPITVSQR